VGLIPRPPWFEHGETPPHHETAERAFHLRTWEIPTPVDFPRELFESALAGHRRLIEEHGADILDLPVLEGGEPQYFEPNVIGFTCTLVVSQGTTVEIDRWRPQDVSFLVQRCRGIVRQLAEETDDDRMYVVVVAEGAASVHLVRAHDPARVGDRARLEIDGPALVVEPWWQWHLRTSDGVLTWWRTPAGDLVVSRVRFVAPRDVRSIVEFLVDHYEPSIRRGLARFRREYAGKKPVLSLRTGVDGESLFWMPRDHASDLVPLARLSGEARRGRRGFLPVVVDDLEWGAVAWLPLEGTDGARPATVFEWEPDCGEPPGPVPDLVVPSHLGKPGPPRPRTPPAEPTPAERRERLGKRLASLERAVSIRMPEIMLADHRRRVREAIDALDADVAKAVLAEHPRAARLMERAVAAEEREQQERERGKLN